MPKTKRNTTFFIDGYEVSAIFAKTGDPAAIAHIKQMLLSSFIAGTPGPRPKGILAISPGQRDNICGGKPHVP